MKISLQILVVEDHPDVRSALGMFLESLGYRAQIARDADTALVAVIERNFDVLITDVLLPGRCGWELMNELRELGCLPPVTISMSGYHVGELAEASSRAMGCAAHLSKPFNPQKLADLLLRAA